MGPYCKFCDNRCFTHIPAGAPEHIVKAYIEKIGDLPIIATCKQGQAFEKERIGYCLNDILAEMAKVIPKCSEYPVFRLGDFATPPSHQS